MKRYRIILPTFKRCTELGIKFEGQSNRTQLWLMGVASGVDFCGSNVTFNVMFPKQAMFIVQTDDSRLMSRVTDYLNNYGCTVEEILS